MNSNSSNCPELKESAAEGLVQGKTDAGAGEQVLPNYEYSGNSLLFIETVLSLSVSRYQTKHNLTRNSGSPEAGGRAALWNTGSLPSFSKKNRCQKNPENHSSEMKAHPPDSAGHFQALFFFKVNFCRVGS